MAAFYRSSAATVKALVVLLACVAALTVSASAAATSTVAGWVDVKSEVAPYVVLRVVDDSTGVVVRSAPLDETHTFSFVGIVPTTFSVEAVAQLPDHLFELDAAASVLKASVATASSTAPVQLKVAAVAKTEAAEKKTAAIVAAAAGSSPVSAVLAFAALVAAWAGRHQIVSALNMPGFKAPKQRKMMVAM